MTSRAMGRVAAITGAAALAVGALLSAVPATAEDAASPSPSPTLESPTASPSASPEASSEATPSPEPSTTDAPEPSGGERLQTISFAYVADLPVGQVAMVKATASSDLDVELAAEGTCRLRIERDQFVAVATNAGSCTVTASQEGDAEFAAAPDATQTFEFYPAESDVSARIPGADVVEIGKPMTVRITVTGEMGSDPAPSGTVTVKVDGLSLETATPESLAGTLDEQGMATIVVPESLTSTLQPGPLTLYAAYVGDNGYQEARASADFQVLAKGSGYVPPPADSPAGTFVRDYRPIKGFAYEPQPSDWAGTDPGTSVNFDSDYYNADFRKLWGPEGRDDLGTMADIGVNLVHIYNWNPGRKYHEAFLSYAAQKGIGVTIPISNYTDCLLAGNDCQGVKGPGSYRNAYSNIEKIFNQVYAGKKPRPGAAMWLVYNEFDETYREGKPIPADSVLFSIQSILQLEKDNGIAPEDRLAISVTTTTSGKFGPAQGIGPTQDVRDVLRKSAEAGGTRTWRGGDGQAVTLDAIPDGFWQRRYIASTNPFQDATALAKMINTTWPNAFKGGDKWSDLPPMFFGETGFSAADFGGSYDRTAEAIRSTLTCTNPIAAGNGFFLGSAIFEYSEENRKAGHGVQGYAKPPRKTTAETTKEWDGGAQTQKTTYTVDALTPYPTWDAVKQGFASTTSTCPQ